MPICSACDNDLPENSFKLVNSRGKKVRRRQCRQCYRDRIKRRELAIPAVLEGRRATARRSQTILRRAPLGWCKQSARALKSKCKKLGIIFGITYQDILDVFPLDNRCPVLGVELILTHSRYNPSVDRLKPGLGYVKGNITVISAKANSIKNDATAEEVRKVADWLAARCGSGQEK